VGSNSETQGYNFYPMLLFCRKYSNGVTTWKKEEEELQQREEEHQRNLAHCFEADHITAVEQQWHKNWVKSFLLPLSPPSNKKMNLINLPPLTKRQCVRYLPKETLEAHQ